MRALIVEDEHKIANSIRRGLTQEKWAADVAYDGNSGYDLASSEDYDLIILDVALPYLSGVDIVKKLRESGRHTPILILTAKGQVADKVEGLNVGADDYMTKPFAFEELLARMKALTRRPKDNLGSTLKYDGLTLNTLTYEVQRDDKNISLSSREFALLEYLLRNPNRVVSKDQIINHVWDYDADVLPNTVEVYMGYLRNKIDKPFGKRALINTIRGFGYKIGD